MHIILRNPNEHQNLSSVSWKPAKFEIEKHIQKTNQNKLIKTIITLQEKILLSKKNTEMQNNKTHLCQCTRAHVCVCVSCVQRMHSMAPNHRPSHSPSRPAQIRGRFPGGLGWEGATNLGSYFGRLGIWVFGCLVFGFLGAWPPKYHHFGSEHNLPH